MNPILENLVNISMWGISALIGAFFIFLLISIMVFLAKRLLSIWGLAFLVILGAFWYSNQCGLIPTPVEYLKSIQTTL
jgi:hypothetical protein